MNTVSFIKSIKFLNNFNKNKIEEVLKKHNNDLMPMITKNKQNHVTKNLELEAVSLNKYFYINNGIFVILDIENSNNNLNEIVEELKNNPKNIYFFTAIRLIEKEIQLNQLKLILKVSETKISKGDIKPLFEQNLDNFTTALLIKEEFSNCKWFIVSIGDSGVSECFANLNNNDFAEFGTVRLSDITESYGLNSSFDDNKFSVKLLKFNKQPDYQEIINFCKS